MKTRLGALAAPAMLIALLASPGCGGGDTPEETVIRPVRTQTVLTSGAGRTRSFSGTARAGMETRLSFKVAGTLRGVSVAVGDRVRAGAPIARLDPTDFELQVDDARAAVTRARAEAERAEADLERIRQLYENENASRTDLDAAEAGATATKAGLESARKNYALATQRLSYTQLAAPVDGAIASVQVEVNENVNAGQLVALLTSGDRPEVEVAVPENLIGDVKEGAAVSARFDALPDRSFPARVTEVGVTASRSGSVFPVTVKLDDAASEVRPGMAAEVEFRFEASGEPRIFVPAVAVLEDRAGRFVFVAEPTEDGLGVARRRDVTVGDLTDHGLEIVGGLQEGDRLVTAGVTRIQDGLVVRLGEPTP